MSTHKYGVGQRVLFSSMRNRLAAKDDFVVIRLLPPEDGQYQYRIKSSAENHERVVREDQIAQRRSSAFND